MFTMEFLEGTHFLHYIGHSSLAVRQDRLRATLPQFGSALYALHSQRLLHRDLKPSNVMVGPGGRVSLLDFGLVRALGDDGARTLAGTPDYMSPEQASGAPLTEASDWYAVGVMLYQALTGNLPFKGTLLEVLNRKQSEAPAPPSDWEPAVDPDLNRLCLGLLHSDPAERMRHAQSALALAPSGGPATATTILKTSLLGRDSELAGLDRAYATTVLESRAVCAHICGPSGVGKSVLLREFLSRLKAADPSVLVFAGRCYESESVPFQGLDDLIDTITHYLRRLPSAQLAQVLPRNFPLMVRMFPVLGQLPTPDRRLPPPLDSVELRARAFSAVRELLGRIAERNRVVLAIDDLQWGDLDGSAFLRELTASAEAPPLLLVLAYRSEDIDALPSLKLLRQASDSVLVDLGGLSDLDTARLAAQQAGGVNALDDASIRTVVEQSGGDPFLIQELVRWMLAHKTSPLGRFDLNIALRSRVDLLAPGPRRLLELVAVAGQPIALEVLKHPIETSLLLAARDCLLGQHLLRSRSVEGRDELEVYHDRIRAAVVGFLESDTLRTRHRELALALDSIGGKDPERLAMHFFAAGETVQAAANAQLAATRAANALAFNKAARFYQLAADTGVFEGTSAFALQRALGDALSNAGRGAEAAEALIKASQNCPDNVERVHLLSHASNQLLRCGHVRRGRELLQSVLSEVGISLPSSRILQILLLVSLRLRIRLRGLDFVPRQTDSMPPSQAAKLDLCGGAAMGLGMSDPLVAAIFSCRFFLLALRSGEPFRVAAALAGQAPLIVRTGGKNCFIQARALIARATAIAANLSRPYTDAFILLMSGTVSYLEGNWKQCRDECEQASEILRSKCSGISWELGTANTFALLARGNRGDWFENRQLLPTLIREAESRGDLYSTLSLRILGFVHILDLASGQPELARQNLDRDLELWSDQNDMQRAGAVVAKMNIALYQNDPERAWSDYESGWPWLQRSGLLRLPAPYAIAHHCRGRVALAMADRCGPGVPSRERFLRVARDSTKCIFTKGLPGTRGLGRLMQAGISSFESSERARQDLALAAGELLEGDHIPYRMAALYRLSAFASGDELAAIDGEIGEWVAKQQITDPARIFASFAPGDWHVVEENVAEPRGAGAFSAPRD